MQLIEQGGEAITCPPAFSHHVAYRQLLRGWLNKTLFPFVPTMPILFIPYKCYLRLVLANNALAFCFCSPLPEEHKNLFDSCHFFRQQKEIFRIVCTFSKSPLPLKRGVQNIPDTCNKRQDSFWRKYKFSVFFSDSIKILI